MQSKLDIRYSLFRVHGISKEALADKTYAYFAKFEDALMFVAITLSKESIEPQDIRLHIESIEIDDDPELVIKP